MRKYVVVAVIGVVLAVSGGTGLARRTDPGPSAPEAGAAASARPAAGGDLGETVAALQSTLRRVPRDHASWAALGLAYVELARLTGDSSLYARADQAVARSLSLEPQDNFAALAAASAVHAARHDFGKALRLADQALAVDDRDLGALSVRVDALTELGRYAAQLRALRDADRKQPGAAVSARYAYAYELRGDLPRAASYLRRASATGAHEDRAYLLTLLADVRRRQGRTASAAAALREAVREAPPAFVPARVSRARLLVAQGRTQAAVEQWRAVVELQPLPEYLTELGELYLHLGRPDQARAQFSVVDATRRLSADNGVNTDLEAALFEADHASPARALASARAEWRRRRSIHVADALGWALHAAGDDANALRYARLATRLGTAEARLWLHRGAIEAGLGLRTAARQHLVLGLSMDLGLSPWQADRARTLLSTLEESA